MLCGRSQHFRTQEAAGGELSVSVQQAFVPEQDTRTALVLEAYLAGGEGTRFHRMESAPDNADLRIGKHDGHGRAAQARIYPLAEREARGILTCNASLVGRLVKQRDEVAGIAGDENRACPIVARAPGGRRIVRWHAFGVELSVVWSRPMPVTLGVRPVAARTKSKYSVTSEPPGPARRRATRLPSPCMRTMCASGSSVNSSLKVATA